MAEEEDLDESLLEVNDRSDVRGDVCGDAALRRLRMLTDLAALNATEEIIIMQYYTMVVWTVARTIASYLRYKKKEVCDGFGFWILLISVSVVTQVRIRRH